MYKMRRGKADEGKGRGDQYWSASNSPGRPTVATLAPLVTFLHSTLTSMLLWAVFAAANIGDTEVSYEIRRNKGHSYL